jgi:hypothetical protein
MRLAAHPSHISQPLDLCVSSLFKVIYKKEKTPKLKGDILKICRAILANYTAAIIPLVRWSFLRAGFRLNPKYLLVPLTITRTGILERIVVPELYLEQFVFSAPNEVVRAAERSTRLRASIPGPTEFAIRLKAYIGKTAATCCPRGHREVQRDREKEEDT